MAGVVGAGRPSLSRAPSLDSIAAVSQSRARAPASPVDARRRHAVRGDTVPRDRSSRDRSRAPGSSSRVMSSAPPSVPTFRLVTEPSGPRFLGLRVGERNARVARRAIGQEVGDAPMPVLIVPGGVAITPALIAALPPPRGTWQLVWDGNTRPIIWRGFESPTSDAHLSTARLPEGAAIDVSTRAARRRAAWRLLRASGKPTDGWLARHVHRRISRVFSYVLLQLGLTANAATVLTFLIGACSAWLAAQTSHATIIGGALLFWFASIADGIDGEMARLTLSESKHGEQLDTAVDHATHFLCYAGLMVGWWRQGIGPRGIALAVGVAIGIPVALLYGMKIVRG